MKILVTGGTGFLGAHLVELLLQKEHDVVVLDSFVTSQPSSLDHLIAHPRLEVIRHDVTSPFPNDIQASQIYHLACPASPIHFTKTPISILETCYQGTKNALEAARKWSATLLLASTSEVYGDSQVCPQPESYYGNVNSFGPRSRYDEGKRVAEALVYAHRLEHCLDVKVARIFNAYGPGMRGSDGRVISSFIAQSLRGRDVIVNGQGNATRSFQYVGDCVVGLRALMESSWGGGPINIGRWKCRSLILLSWSYKGCRNWLVGDLRTYGTANRYRMNRYAENRIVLLQNRCLAGLARSISQKA